jgi:phage gpG-like protein
MGMEWYGREIEIQIHKVLAMRLAAAAYALKNYIQTRLSVPNVIMQAGSKYAAGRGKAVRGTRGRAPSAPGEYPRKLTGQLRRNIGVENDPTALVSRVGTNVVYGRHLELGTKRMRRRPWMTMAVQEMSTTIRQILGGGGSE